MNCPKCGHEILFGEESCKGCGAKLKWSRGVGWKAVPGRKPAPTSPKPAAKEEPPPGPWACPSCGAEMAAEAKFCSACGTARTPAAGGTPTGGGQESKEGNVGTRQYDAAVRISQEIESQVAQTSELFQFGAFGAVPMFIGCHFWHELWIFLVVGCIAAAIAAAYRQGVRSNLRKHDVAGAKSLLGAAKFWFVIAIIADVVGALVFLGHLWAACHR